MKRILVVDDSNTVRQLMVYEIDRQEDMKVVGVAANGEEAIRQAKKLCPDVITMDFKMPIMDGLEATREIMCTQACPIIMVSQYWDEHDKQTVFDALAAGAIAVVNKPAGPGHPEYETTLTHLLKNIRMMSEIRVITRRRTRKPVPPKEKIQTLVRCGITCPPACRDNCPVQNKTCERVLIGASTGGPIVLRELFENLPAPYPLPILVVQHIAAGFLPGFIDWLATASGHVIQIAKHGETPLPGHIYFAPDDCQMGLSPSGNILLADAPKEHSLRPSVAYLFRSAAANGGGKNIGILLTGMGADGAEGLKLLKDTGAVTIIQDEESCVVFGMPGEALKLDAPRHILSPQNIANFLIKV